MESGSMNKDGLAKFLLMSYGLPQTKENIDTIKKFLDKSIDKK